jgi:hypothetical protein
MPKGSRQVTKAWMLRTSPHNEDFILAVARKSEDLEEIAIGYIRSLYDDLDYVNAQVDLKNKTVQTSSGTHGDLEGNQQTFYISEVDIL